MKDFDYNIAANQGAQTLSKFAMKNGQSFGSSILSNGISYLKNPGDLEKEIVKKGMKKGQKAEQIGFMNDKELIESR